MPDVRFSFEPSDIVNDIMSFGSPTPVEIAVSGPNFADDRSHADKVCRELDAIPYLRDLQFGQSLDYPTIEVNVDREKAGLAGLVPTDVSRALVTATSSSRFVVPNYWADPKSGIAYQVQVELPRQVLRNPDNIKSIGSAQDLAQIPLKQTEHGQIHIGDVADFTRHDAWAVRPLQHAAANHADRECCRRGFGDRFAGSVEGTPRAGQPPTGVQVETRGQIPPMQQMQSASPSGWRWQLSPCSCCWRPISRACGWLVTVSAAPAVIAGVALMLWLTGTTLNIQSFIGAIMAIGVAMANAILLVTFAENRRREGASAAEAAQNGATSRLRAILMTSCAMIAGMLPMALGLGEAGQQNGPLGRAVIGGLLAATCATLLVLPCAFAMVQQNASPKSPSLDPGDRESLHYQPVTN